MSQHLKFSAHILSALLLCHCASNHFRLIDINYDSSKTKIGILMDEIKCRRTGCKENFNDTFMRNISKSKMNNSTLLLDIANLNYKKYDLEFFDPNTINIKDTIPLSLPDSNSLSDKYDNIDLFLILKNVTIKEKTYLIKEGQEVDNVDVSGIYIFWDNSLNKIINYGKAFGNSETPFQELKLNFNNDNAAINRFVTQIIKMAPLY
jgi:hypothetical protein